jgi:transposase-like protein
MFKYITEASDCTASEVTQTLDELAREGARRMIAAALEVEVAEYIERLRGARDGRGHALAVRNGKARARKVTLGVGTVEIRAPRVNDRREGHRFRSQILPPYMRRSPQLEEVLPALYLRGLSTGDFQEALAALLGPQAAGLSPTTINRLTQVWQEEYQAWRKRPLQGKDYVYIWVDGLYFGIRLEEDRLACLVVIGVLADGRKEVIALEDGYRESQESWATLLRDLKQRGMPAPVLAIGDGALGFGLRCGRFTLKLVSNAAGCTRFAMCSISCRKGCSRGPRLCCTRSCKRRIGPVPKRRWLALHGSSKPATPSLWSVC